MRRVLCVLAGLALAAALVGCKGGGAKTEGAAVGADKMKGKQAESPVKAPGKAGAKTGPGIPATGKGE